MSFETPHSSLDYSTPRASLDGIPAPMYPQVRTRCTPPSRLLSPPTLHPPPSSAVAGFDALSLLIVVCQARSVSPFSPCFPRLLWCSTSSCLHSREA